MFFLKFDLDNFKNKFLFKKPGHFKRSFLVPSDILEEFYKILFNPQYDAPSSNEDTYPSLVKIRNATKVVPPEVWGHKVNNSFYRDANALKKAINLKCSVIFDQYYRYSKQAAEVVAFFQKQFNCIGGCNAYLSQKDGRAFPIHCDAHHVLIFALTGKKRWKIYNQQQAMIQAYHEVDSLHSDEEIVQQGIALDVIMQPGDMLYIPIGQFHNVDNLTNNAFHLTLSMSFRPLLSIIEDAFKEIYTSPHLSLSAESLHTINEVHPLLKKNSPIKKEELLEALARVNDVLKELLTQDSFVENQNKIQSNEILELCYTPTEQFIQELINCSK
jgi:hypothetical protein